MSQYIIVEKKNHLAVHAHCSTLESANHWIEALAPQYCAKGYFMDKTLTPSCFEVIERTNTKRG
jgi:non-ribosomal peptide synthetase component E (peptide arylation enzyme)